MKKRFKLISVTFIVAISAGLSIYYFTAVSQPWYILTNTDNYLENISGDSAVMLYNDTLVFGNDKKDLKFFDLSAEDSLIPTDTLRLPVLASRRFEIVDDLLFTIEGNRFYIVNITDRVNNGVVDSYLFTYYIEDFCLDGDLAYVTSFANLLILNISVPENITQISQNEIFFGVHGLTVDDNLLYIAENLIGVKVYNVSDPTSPQFITQMRDYHTYGLESVEALNVRVSGSLLLIMDTNNGLIIYNQTTPGNFDLLSSTLAMGDSKTFVVVDNLVYIGGIRGLKVIDITNPVNPIIVGEITDHHRVLDLVVYESNAYILHSTGISLYQILPGDGPNPVKKEIAVSVITGFLQILAYLVLAGVLFIFVRRSKIL
ncbi:MAG: LVIVD repeat-containing protein [Promethearchaeota archaeon]